MALCLLRVAININPQQRSTNTWFSFVAEGLDRVGFDYIVALNMWGCC